MIDASFTRQRQLLDLIRQRFAAMTRDHLDDPWAGAVIDRIEAIDLALTRAAGNPHGRARSFLVDAVYMVALWAVASAANLLGLPPGWVIVVALVVLMALTWPIRRVTNAFFLRLDRWRTRPVGPLELPIPLARNENSDVTGLLYLLRNMIRRSMNELLRSHRFGPVARTAAGFQWLVERDALLYWLSRGDTLACQAIEVFTIWSDRRLPAQDER